MLSLRQYTVSDSFAWDEFVRKSKNGTFLFLRDYMDYHSDRFTDHSMIFYDEHDIRMLLPANIVGDCLYSHQGLTYGGFVFSSDTSVTEVIEACKLLNDNLCKENIRRVVYKPVPHIYHQQPAEEDLYALHWICRAQLHTRDIGTALHINNHPRWSRVRRRGVKRAQEAGVKFNVNDDIEAFWSLLERNLMEKHGVRPVHTVEEMRLLKSRFPENILLYSAYEGDNIIGGILLYICNNVVHAQYSSANKRGKEIGALDFLYHKIIYDDFAGFEYFDWGRSTEDDGHILNEQLIFQKEGFGGRTVIYDSYEYTLSEP